MRRKDRFDELAEGLARALWAVRVLDAWAEANPGRCYRAMRVTDIDPSPGDGEWVCTPFPSQRLNSARRFGPTPDAARHAAALAVFDSLPEDVRAKLGECP